MPASISPQDFVAKWKHATLKEHAAAQSHFNDLCALIGHPTPSEADHAGTWFTYEAGATKQTGGQGWADVWKMGYFAWEYKGQHADLDKAYRQLLLYRESLMNPPLLIVCDLQRIVIHTNFTNTVKRVVVLTLDDLLHPEKLAILRQAFTDPNALRSEQTPEGVTELAAVQFARLASLLRERGEDPHAIAHFLIRLLFCLFAEDAGILPEKLFTRLVNMRHRSTAALTAQVRQLFAAMATGGPFGVDDVPHVDGGLFEDDSALDLDADGLRILSEASGLDWAAIEPSVLGTLFERSLDPGKRSQLGAHYTGKDDILLIVEPVLMAPLRRRWQEVRKQAMMLAEKRDLAAGSKPSPKKTRQLAKIEADLFALLRGFRAELAAVQVLDPACGSGNFLHIALRQLLSLEQEVINLAASLGDSRSLPMVAPDQLHGIEINLYARELAQATIWIGYIQWFRENGYGVPAEPILKPLDAVVQMDAILAYDAAGAPVEPAWPATDVIIGNPPFLGDKKMRGELGDGYVENLRTRYAGRIPGGADLVTYWFERARAQIEAGKAKRAGLLATNSIRQQQNRGVLERIKGSGDMFAAWSDRPWILDGAAVRVSIIAFDDGQETSRTLDGKAVKHINADLTSLVDVTLAVALAENASICFLGMMKAGPFDLDDVTAQHMLGAPLNPNGRPNSDVVPRRLGGQDVAGRPRNTWVIDFGTDRSQDEAALYELPFEYVREHVKPVRDSNRRKRTRERWWIYGEARPGLRKALAGLSRCIVTPEVAKHRPFAWMETSIVPDHTTHVIARDDDYFFGVVHCRVHEVWSLAQGARMGVGNDPRYSSSKTFSTFPFPWPPGQEPADDPRIQAIAEAAQELVQFRDAWLNPPGASEAELKKRTLTNLYNQRPGWLDNAHLKLDAAVLAAYGWPSDLAGEEILERLLALNLERAALQPR